MDYTPLLLVLIAGAAGGFAYDWSYKLLTMNTYLSAFWHVVLGAAAGGLIFWQGLAGAPVDLTSAWPYLTAGYFATDLLDSVVQKIAASTVPVASTPATPPAA